MAEFENTIAEYVKAGGRGRDDREGKHDLLDVVPSALEKVVLTQSLLTGWDSLSIPWNRQGISLSIPGNR